MKPHGMLVIAACISNTLAFASPPPPTSALIPVTTVIAGVSVATKREDLRLAMRQLWEDHITYTRNFIISTLADLPDQQAVTERLLANQKDIGNAVKPYYGAEAGDKLTGLLREHILIAADVVKAAKVGSTDSLAKAQKRWNANGKDIAAFLSGANPNWSKSSLESMLQKHLDFTTGEVVARLQKNWVADIKSYDDGHMHMMMFSDALTEGIVKQFSNKFLG